MSRIEFQSRLARIWPFVITGLIGITFVLPMRKSGLALPMPVTQKCHGFGSVID